MKKPKHVVVQTKLPRPISACSQSESIRSQIQRMGPISTASKKVVVPVSPWLSMEEDGDFDEQLGNTSFSSAAAADDDDTDDSMWLSSSGCLSPSSFFEEHELFCPFHHLVTADEWLVSWQSTMADSRISSFSNSCKSKAEEHRSFALAKAAVSGKMLQEGDLNKDEEGIIWQLNSPGNHAIDLPADESTSDGDYFTSVSADLDDSSCQVSDMDQTSFIVSSLNLDDEGSLSSFSSSSCKIVWDSEAKSSISKTINRKDETPEFNLFLDQTSDEAERMEDFCADDRNSEAKSCNSTTINRKDEMPESNLYQTSEAEKVADISGDEPLFWPFERKIDWNSEAKSSIYTTINRKDETPESNLSLDQTSEAEKMADFGADEPLFWPFDRKIDWNSEETWKFFSMSPRKDIIKVTTPDEKSPKYIGSDLNNRHPNLPNKFSRKLALNSVSITASKLLELKQGSRVCNNNGGSCKVRMKNTMPSRLRELSAKDSVKVVPLNVDNQVPPLKVAEVPTMRSGLTGGDIWVDDDFTSNEELSIETVLGLGEFDGHEGIDSEFIEGAFCLMSHNE